MKIAVTGKMRSGKDTLANFFIKELHYKQLAFADGIKQIGNEFFPEIMGKGKPRKMFQVIGQSLREVDPDVWVNHLDRQLKMLQEYGVEAFIITDVRQLNEYNYVKEQGFTVIKVEAEDEIRQERIIQAGDIFSPENFYHETELAVDEIPADYILSNNTTLEDFYTQILFVYKELKGEQTHG